MDARRFRSVLPACVLFALLSMGCGGAHILGSLPMPPGVGVVEAERLAEQAAIPDSQHGFPLARPAAARVYPTGELIVDVMVVEMGTRPRWETRPGEAVSESDSAGVARFHTNGLAVPAQLHSDRREKTSLLIKDELGRDIKATRVVLDKQEEPPESWRATKGYLDSVRVIAIQRAGLPYHVYFVPILLSTDRPIQVGEELEVRLRPRDGTSYDIDNRWYKLVVEAFHPEPGARP